MKEECIEVKCLQRKRHRGIEVQRLQLRIKHTIYSVASIDRMITVYPETQFSSFLMQCLTGACNKSKSVFYIPTPSNMMSWVV